MAARRPVEDFSFTPPHNTRVTGHHRRAVMAHQIDFGDYSPHDASSSTIEHDVKESSLDWKANTRTFTSSPVFYQTYGSEEELASPTGLNDFSFDEVSSNASTSRRASLQSEPFPEQLAETSSKIEQQCSRAQAVKLISAGKAKMVSMPKLVENTASPSLLTPADGPPMRVAMPRLNTTTTSQPAGSSLVESPTSSPFPDSPSTTPNIPKSASKLIERGKNVRRSIHERPSLPNLHNNARSQYSLQNRLLPTDQAADFLQHDPYPSTPPHLPDSPDQLRLMSPSRRRMHKISSSFSQYVFRNNNNNNNNNSNSNNTQSSAPSSTLPSSEDESETVMEPVPVMLMRPTTIHIPKRTSSARPKMIPRGASERAAPLVLPPCPKGYESELEIPKYPLRRDATATGYEEVRRPVLHHRRRQSLTAALVAPALA
ncbi:hypothetical protein LTR62_008552 [Meristemomyces frigidus]|uniref:Uncharacterized protein n=1 Tax=Meristemomyces frigidus TaxID=1508187 RepID=A0AAN7YR51_9PEZI|nr:hypothetical protein LTR62_008552 [Meristemomyces frigidus]